MCGGKAFCVGQEEGRLNVTYTWSNIFVVQLNYSFEGLFSLLSLTLRIDSTAATNVGASGNVN